MTARERQPASIPATRDGVPVAAALIGGLATLTLLAVLSAAVSEGWTVGFDDRARKWFWPSGEWGWQQRVGDVVVEGLRPWMSVLLLLAGGALAALRRRSPWPLVMVGAAVVLLTAGVLVLRAAVTRVDMHGVDGSYPSGHEASIVVTVGTLLLAARWRAVRSRTVLGAGALAALVKGTALLVTGTHWCTDVVGGALLGFAVLACMCALVATVPIAALGAGLSRAGSA